MPQIGKATSATRWLINEGFTDPTRFTGAEGVLLWDAVRNSASRAPSTFDVDHGRDAAEDLWYVMEASRFHDGSGVAWCDDFWTAVEPDGSLASGGRLLGWH